MKVSIFTDTPNASAPVRKSMDLDFGDCPEIAKSILPRMVAVSRSDAGVWLGRHGLSRDFDDTDPAARSYKLSMDAGKLLYLAKELALGWTLPTDGEFLVLVESRIWLSSEVPLMLELLRSPDGLPSLDEAPGTILRADETGALVALIAVGLVNIWDVRVADSLGSRQVWLSHDERITVVDSQPDRATSLFDLCDKRHVRL